MLKKFRTFTLSVQFYQKCKLLKLNKYLFDQILRASSSICLNLAEGYAKPTYKDQRRFYYIAMGSFRECEAVIIMENIQDQDILQLADQLGASLYKLCQSPAPHKSKRTVVAIST